MKVELGTVKMEYGNSFITSYSKYIFITLPWEANEG